MLDKEIFIDIKTISTKERLDQLKNDFSKDNLSSAGIKILSDTLLYDIFSHFIYFTPPEKADERVIKARAFINENIGESLTLKKVANHIFLSPERTRHLFLEQVEVPLSQYIFWKRIKSVLTAAIHKTLPIRGFA